MRNRKRNCYLPLLLIPAVGIFGVGELRAQDTARPWMNPKLSPEERTELVLKQLTLDEKLALLHGTEWRTFQTGRCLSRSWQMAGPDTSKALSAWAYRPGHFRCRIRRQG